MQIFGLFQCNVIFKVYFAYFSNTLTTESLPATAAHQRGVTLWDTPSSATSNTPLCSISAPQVLNRYSTTSAEPFLQAKNNGAQPSSVWATTSFRSSLPISSIFFLSFPKKKKKSQVKVRIFQVCSQNLKVSTYFDE